MAKRPIPKRTWHLKFTADEMAGFAGQTKVCPHCGESKDIINEFGLRRLKPSGKIAAKCPCFSCNLKKHTKYHKERMLHDSAYRTKYLQRIRKWRKENSEQARIAEAARRKRNWQRDKLKYAARIMAHALYPIRKKCSVETCDNLGQRHHLDYNEPKEIIWLCQKHHALLHRSTLPTGQEF